MATYIFTDALTNRDITMGYPGLNANVIPHEKGTRSDGDRHVLPAQTIHGDQAIFFPGCSFLNYALPLVDAVYDTLLQQGEVNGISVLCCGKILDFEHQTDEVIEDFNKSFADHVVEVGIDRFVVSCPNCYDTLQRIFETDERCAHVKVEALPVVLARIGYRIDGNELRRHVVQSLGEQGFEATNPGTIQVAVHDSCPDRKYGVFADGVRALFAQNDISELSHTRSHTRCCGSLARAAGKMDVADRMALRKADEALEVGASAIVTSCMSCVNQISGVVKAANLQNHDHPMVIYHYLELLYSWDIPWAYVGSYMKLRFLFDDLEAGTSRSFMGIEDVVCQVAEDNVGAVHGEEIVAADDIGIFEQSEER